MDSTASDPQQTEIPAEAAEPVAPAEAVVEVVAEAEVAAELVPEVVVSAAAAILAVNAGVGATLRAAREGMGKSLPECAKLLRIRQPFLEALEEGRHGDLPGGTYAAGFLRSYAEFLSLDSEEMVRRFREEGAGGFKNRTELTFPSPVSEGRIPGGAVIFLGLILAAVAYGGWYMLSSAETKVTEMVPPLPDRLAGVLNRQASLTGEGKMAAETPKPAEEKAKEEVVPPLETEEEKPAAIQPPAQPQSAAAPEPPKVEPPKVEAPKVEPPKVEAPKVEAPKVEPPKVEPPKPEVVPTTSIPDGKIYGTEYADARVVLKATGDDCWIQVREVDGSLLMSRLLRRGDSFRVPNRSGLTLMVGNAGSLEVSVDGRKAQALGAAGQVRRDIRLDPDKLATGG